MNDHAVGVQLPRFRCHKEVSAAVITEMTDRGISAAMHGGWRFLLTLADPAGNRFGEQPVTAEWFNRHQPKVGGYYVVYADGYASFSPAKAFEEGYSRI